jgi:hypothetical protein
VASPMVLPEGIQLMDMHEVKPDPRQSKYASSLSLHGLTAVVLTIMAPPLGCAEDSVPPSSPLLSMISSMVCSSND